MTLHGPLHCRDTGDDDDHLTNLISTHRYIQARVPVREDANPRGKYPRKPLPWSAAKLSRVTGWEEDADLYREQLWRQQQKETNEAKSDDDPSFSTPSKPKHKRINNPHYLTALDAMSNHKGNLRYYVGCSCCYDATRLSKIRDYKREWPRQCADGQREVEIEYMIQDYISTDSWRFEDWLPEPISPGDQIISPDFISMNHIVRQEQPVYQIRYQTERRRRTSTRKSGVGGATALTRENISKQAGYDGYMHHGDGLESESEWDCLDGESESDNDGSVWTDVGESAFKTEDWDSPNSSDEEGYWVWARRVSL